MPGFVIGVDGGGTKTLGAIASLDGNIISQTEVGSTNHHSNPMEAVRSNLDALITNLRGAAGASADDVECICLGMAGVDRPDDKVLIGNLIAEYLPKAKCIAVNDGLIALVGGAEKDYGIIVISGTGSIAFGIDREGRRERAGGWGNILGDEGSGYALGLRGLRSVCRAHDGRIGPTVLTQIILQHFGFDRAEQLLGWVKEIQGNKAEIAALSRLIQKAQAAGDGTADQIMREEAGELAEAARAVADRLFKGVTGYEIVVGGGNLRKSEAYFAMFREAVEKRLPGIPAILPRREPVEGAVLHALNNRG